ncbi:hypothetical protein SAMN04487944_105152 [Gracilibacillus ureilyticus]|uniref:Extracellular solute-binding protein n=1 Tax=Gracilibacillus ureilyticus TaxID=531814 RepID=A0A1H9PVH0_9BACI|nr:hypothetical protein [Gracilibacillus ureilyticus]SER51769.1 hypothetical protein SAMN04487944_105152 [Gracilibacillus ureilyticus]
MKKLLETLKTMSFKEAADYIWEYYKLHIIGIIVGLFVIISIISSIVKEDEELYNAMVVSSITYEEVGAFGEQMNEEHFDNFRFAVDNITHNGGELSEQSYEQVQKLIVRIATGEVDLIITDEIFAEELIDQEGLKPIEQVVDLSMLEQKNIELLDFGTGTVYGIKSNNLDVFRDREMFHDRILIIPATSKKDDLSELVLKTLIES